MPNNKGNPRTAKGSVYGKSKKGEERRFSASEASHA
jgi:hypothetical protein